MTGLETVPDADGMGAERIGRGPAFALFRGLLAEPILASRALHRDHGRFVQLEYPIRKKGRSCYMSAIADAGLYRELMADGDLWRNIKINWGWPNNRAPDRLTRGMTRLRHGDREHYRLLLAAPLKRPAVEAMSVPMAEIARNTVRAWPREAPFDIRPATQTLAQELAVGLLFGRDRERAREVTDLITLQIRGSWPVPSLATLRWHLLAGRQERLLCDWIADRTGDTDPSNLLSVLANNPDSAGNQPDAEMLAGILTFTYGAAFETCQNGLAWALILLTQHPTIRDQLTEEVTAACAGEIASIDKIGNLPLLDSVVREAMRLFPPVPILFRKSTAETTLGGEVMPFKSRVMISAHVINRDPGTYEDGDAFRPERWQTTKPSAYKYPVYGAGAHMCPGAVFGNQMLKIALATILTTHSIDMADDARVDYRSTITMAPAGRPFIVLNDPSTRRPPHAVPGVLRQLVTLPALDEAA
ncbi:MAG: cytochrome P450 [Pseudomonadota bacterium]